LTVAAEVAAVAADDASDTMTTVSEPHHRWRPASATTYSDTHMVY